jgi:hypothetical protein
MSKPLKLWEYQKIAFDFMLNAPRSALLAGMGMGKTLATLSLIDVLYMLGDEGPWLVLGPLRVARDTWPRETQKWDSLKHIRSVPLIGTAEERVAALERGLATGAQLFTMNYDTLVVSRKDPSHPKKRTSVSWLREALGKRKWPFRTVIADESTRLKGHRSVGGGVRARELSIIARDTDRWHNLTGTPAPNGLKDMWGQYWFLDYGHRLGRTHTAFMERWFRPKWNGYGVEPMPFADGQIHAAVSDITLSIRPEDWFDLDEPIRKEVRVYMPPTAKRKYKELEAKLFTELESGTELEVFNAGALCNKCLQFANGAVYTDAPAWETVHEAKMEALDSIAEEANGAALLVSYQFISDRVRILKAFPNAVDISTQAGMAEFMSGKKQLGVAHEKSMGHGIDGLQDVCNMLVRFGHGWDLELRDQMLERIGPMRQFQSGHKRPVWVWDIITDDTLDDDVIARHVDKRSVQDALLAAMARRAA